MTKAEAEAQADLNIVPASTDLFGARAAVFDRLINDRIALKDVIKSSEDAIRAIDEQLEVFLADVPSKTVLSNGSKVTQVVNTGRGTIKAELLIEHGVAATIIKECTVYSKASSYILVTAPKQK